MNLFMLFVTLFVSVNGFLFPISNPVPISNCGNTPKPTQVYIEGCTNAPCQLSRGKSLIFQTNFVPKNSSRTLQLEMMANAYWQTININLPPEISDACKNLIRGKCPFKSNDILSYNASIPISSVLPHGLKATLTASFKDEFNKILICGKVQVIII